MYIVCVHSKLAEWAPVTPYNYERSDHTATYLSAPCSEIVQVSRLKVGKRILHV